MFTGIVEELGQVIAVEKTGGFATLVIQGEKIFDDIRLGDSISVNGVCLTVNAYTNHTFCADVMNETLQHTTLGELTKGVKVNLERAMKAEGRFGGHIVSGHVDGCGRIKKIQKIGNGVWFTIHASEDILRYIIKKGSITVDGISLTVVNVDKVGFCISTIPHTVGETTLGNKRIGDNVNLENDLFGKYIEQFMKHAMDNTKQSQITKGFLDKYGFEWR